MIVDGKKLAEEIKEALKKEVAAFGKPPRLAVVQVGSDPVTEKFLEQKKKFGKEIGVDVRVYQLPADVSTTELRKKISQVVHIEKNTAVIIQLPLPKEINTQYILDGIIPNKDADMLSSKSVGLFATGRSDILPPVVGAVKYIFEKYNVEIKGKHVVIVGAGRLVGKPLAIWLLNQGATLSVIDENTPDARSHTLSADILISGVGKPGLVTTDMIKEKAIVIDCGTAEYREAGRLVGDCDSAVAEKASLFTPVPGGVGPLTVAMLFSNVLKLGRD